MITEYLARKCSSPQFSFKELPWAVLYASWEGLWMLLRGIPWMVVGIALGWVLLVVYQDAFVQAYVERWSFEDEGHTWECHRVLGSKAICSTYEPGQLTLYRGEVEHFAPCTVTQTKVLEEP